MPLAGKVHVLVGHFITSVKLRYLGICLIGLPPYPQTKEVNMFISMLKCKIHRARVTNSEVDYEGSCAIDSEFLKKTGILLHEQIQIYNVTNGERFTTYAIEAPKGSKTISVNGAAAHKARVGDVIIICAYGIYNEKESLKHHPKVLYIGEKNIIKSFKG